MFSGNILKTPKQQGKLSHRPNAGEENGLTREIPAENLSKQKMFFISAGARPPLPRKGAEKDECAKPGGVGGGAWVVRVNREGETEIAVCVERFSAGISRVKPFSSP